MRRVPPIINALIDCLPEPGSVWPLAERAKWLRCAEAVFAIVYNPKVAALEREEE